MGYLKRRCQHPEAKGLLRGYGIGLRLPRFDFAVGGSEAGLRGVVAFGYGEIGIHPGLLAQQNRRGQDGVASDFHVIAHHCAEL